jgi:ferredoxin
MMKYKIVVDRDSCIACGVAPSLCPQVFVLGEDNGKNRAVEKYSKALSGEKSVGEIPKELYDCAKEAVNSCPVQAISIEEVQ